MSAQVGGALVLVSAHRCGAGLDAARENTTAALLDAARSGVDHVEFDVLRCADGTFVVRHDDAVVEPSTGRSVRVDELDVAALEGAVGEVLTFDALLAVLAEHGKGAHLDLKLTSPADLYAAPDSTYEVEAVRRAVDVLGHDRVAVTSREVESVAAVRSWSSRRHPDLLVGLSLGGRRERLVRDLFPHRVMRLSRANLVVAQHRHARLVLARFARRRGLPLLVWTVDDDRRLRYWLRPGRAWLVTSNVPEQALAVRSEVARTRG